jgi:hypothetical protein
LTDRIKRRDPELKELKDMEKPELLEVIRIKDILIKELREEIDIYIELTGQLQEKLKGVKNEV